MPGWAIGIRPVPTWKSTAAAPTPTRDGPYWPPFAVLTPSAFLPWQEAQPTRNSALPLATMSSSALLVWAVAGVRAAYIPPVSSSPRSRTSGAATRLRRPAESRPEIR